MSDLIDGQTILKHIEKKRQDAQMMDDIRRAGIIMTGMDLLEEAVKNQPSAQPNLEKPDRSCKTCYYFDEFLGGVFFCRRVKEAKRVKPDFWCKKWRGEQR